MQFAFLANFVTGSHSSEEFNNPNQMPFIIIVSCCFTNPSKALWNFFVFVCSASIVILISGASRCVMTSFSAGLGRNTFQVIPLDQLSQVTKIFSCLGLRDSIAKPQVGLVLLLLINSYVSGHMLKSSQKGLRILIKAPRGTIHEFNHQHVFVRSHISRQDSTPQFAP